MQEHDQTGDPASDGTDGSAAREAALDALRSAVADGGVDCDGLTISHGDDGYVYETPTMRRVGLGDDDLGRVVRANPAYANNWYFWTEVVGDRDPARWTFLRWVEGVADGDADSDFRDRRDALRAGHAREWGEILVQVTLDDEGRRRYEVRHHEDTERDHADLEVHEDPRDARQLVKYDDRGRYRPLKTAPTLPTGWVFADLDPEELLSLVDYVYPATVTNWYREREGDLDISHWRDTTERQTGIYGIVEEMDREAVEWVASACCDDSQCLKRREWQYDEGDDLDADGGDGVFPCREPCSLVVAASRKWTTLEREDEHTYEFTLTASEKAQVEAIIDAVADGRIDQIREADVYEGANRYRARFLREKRFDEHGNFCGVPTEIDDDSDDH